MLIYLIMFLYVVGAFTLGYIWTLFLLELLKGK